MTEIFERFTYYGMRAHAGAVPGGGDQGDEPGLRHRRDDRAAPSTACTPARLSRLAARRLDRRPPHRSAQRAVCWGGIFIMIGNFILRDLRGARRCSSAASWSSWSASDCSSRTSSAMVGALYAGSRGARRDAGFSHLLHGHQPRRASSAPLVAGTIGEVWNWRVRISLLPAVVMALGRSCNSASRSKHLGDAGLAPPRMRPARAGTLEPIV